MSPANNEEGVTFRPIDRYHRQKPCDRPFTIQQEVEEQIRLAQRQEALRAAFEDHGFGCHACGLEEHVTEREVTKASVEIDGDLAELLSEEQ